MGSGASAGVSEAPGGELRLPVSGLRFSADQLLALNHYVDKLADEDLNARIPKDKECIVENLVQSLVDGAGELDPRFRCRHLVALHRGKKMRSESLEYLVVLDSLSAEGGGDWCVEADGAEGAGYVRLRAAGRRAADWADLTTASGHLCRERVVERWVSLIASAAGAGAGARGGGACRVMSARERARARPGEYFYFDTAAGTPEGESAAPWRQLAVVQRPGGASVRAAPLPSAKLLLAAAAPPSSAPAAHLPPPPPLTHPLALLHYTNMQTGYFAVCVGPSGTRRAWQLWRPALEQALDELLHERAPAARLAAALNALVTAMRDHHEPSCMSRYLAGAAWRRRLAALGARPAPARALLADHVSHHLLALLDELLGVCVADGGAWHACARRGARGDWRGGARALRRLLDRMQHVAATAEPAGAQPAAGLELALARARAAPRGPLSAAQLRYLALLATLLTDIRDQQAAAPGARGPRLVLTLAVVLDQARDAYLNHFFAAHVADGDKELYAYRSKKWNKLKDYYDASSACLIDAVRRDPETRSQDLSDPVLMMKSILTWLQRGAKDDKKYLGPVLKPFLEQLYTSSLEHAWIVEEHERSEREYRELRDYCEDVVQGRVEPAPGLAARRARWARRALALLHTYRHVDVVVVFPTAEGEVRRRVRGARAAAARASARRRDDAKLALARRVVQDAFLHALRPRGPETPLSHHGSQEILTSVQNGNYWRNDSKPDIIPSYQYGGVEGGPRKYHTVRAATGAAGARAPRARSAGASLARRDTLSRPSVLHTMDRITTGRDAPDAWPPSDAEEPPAEWSPCAACSAGPLRATPVGALHVSPGGLVTALLHRHQYTVLQQLCSQLRAGREAALFALHRLARAADHHHGRQPPGAGGERYRARAPDYVSCDESDAPPPPPPPLPRRSSRDKVVIPIWASYTPPSRDGAPSYTGIINPVSDVKLGRDKFAVKRAKSLGRSSSKGSAMEACGAGSAGGGPRSLGRRAARRTNDVLTAMSGSSAPSALGDATHFFQKHALASVVGDSYRMTRATID